MAKARALMRKDQVAVGLNQFLKMIFVLRERYPGYFGTYVFMLAKELEEIGYFAEAKDAYKKVLGAEVTSDIKAVCQRKVSDLEIKIRKNLPFAPALLPTLDQLGNLKRMISRSISLSLGDLCCRNLYRNTENKVSTDFLFEVPIKFVERPAFIRDYSFQIVKKPA